ncbi:MAG: asparagine synthase (glutamine-hydrolyzing) [Pseudorhodoplanes sp.]
MCGIVGFVGSGEVGDLRAMMALLRHRGPDGEGDHADLQERVFLGQTRLAIIDREGGRQPMWNEDGTVAVVFNGEIYNHMELRAALIARGHVFRSDHSDTEVLVHGYEQWGEDLPLKLNGMFAFAIFDARQRALFLARDRFGEKPLYWSVTPQRFIFASEMTAMRRHPDFSPDIDPSAVMKYLAHGFFPAPSTLYRQARKLSPGSSLRFSLADWKTREKRYWRFRVAPEDDDPAKDGEKAEELRHLLSEAVRRRLISDVPLGIFASGGIDSSAVLAFAARHLAPARPRSFSIGFREPSFDESAFARQAASFVGSQHTESILDLEEARVLSAEVLGKLDEPIADASFLPTYFLSRLARQDVTVALGGDGGDELFAGYDPFRALSKAALYERIVPKPMHRIMRKTVDRLPVSTANMSLDFKLKRALRGLSYPRSLWNPVWLGPLEPSEIGDFFGRPAPVEDIYSEALSVWHDTRASSLADRTTEFYANFYLPDGILTKVDRASMLVSLEVRAPFLDNDLVAFATRLPHAVKVRHGQKSILKKAVEGLVPPEIIARPKKGFGIPLAAWLRDMTIPALSIGAPPLSADWVERRHNEHRHGSADHRLFLWAWNALAHHAARNDSSASQTQQRISA